MKAGSSAYQPFALKEAKARAPLAARGPWGPTFARTDTARRAHAGLARADTARSARPELLRARTPPGLWRTRARGFLWGPGLASAWACLL
eukprot:3527702-Alexandrium_andersonii.AAC.1